MQIQDISPLLKFWTIDGELTLHRNVANYIYFSKMGSKEIVVRLTPISQRSAKEIDAELSWMNELAGKKILVPTLIRSIQENLFETLTVNGQQFHVMVMEKINGTRIDENLIDEKIIKQWADLLSQLQLNAKSVSSGLARFEWFEDYIIKSSAHELTQCPPETQKLYKELMTFLENYPKDQYGLIHGDVHTGNFFYKDDEIIVFDFDDCCYHWFLYDLTVPVLSIYKMWDGDEHLDKKIKFINLFIKNYFKTMPKPKNFKSDFKKFLQFRNVIVHVWLRAIRKERELSEKMAAAFDLAIAEDLRMAIHPDIFDFIED